MFFKVIIFNIYCTLTTIVAWTWVLWQPISWFFNASLRSRFFVRSALCCIIWRLCIYISLVVWSLLMQIFETHLIGNLLLTFDSVYLPSLISTYISLFFNLSFIKIQVIHWSIDLVEILSIILIKQSFVHWIIYILNWLLAHITILFGIFISRFSQEIIFVRVEWLEHLIVFPLIVII